MTIHHQAHQQRIDAGLGFEWDLLPPVVEHAAEIPLAAEEVRIRRVGSSYRGVRRLKMARRIWAISVDQAFLEEMSELPLLEVLHLDGVTATDLSPMRGLRNLKRLTVIGATKVKDLSWVETFQSLHALGIENMKRVSDLSPLAELTQLTALGIEGSMWTPMRIASLAPLRTLQRIEYLFATHLRVGDRSLKPLHNLPRLKVLQCARFFPRDEFAALEKSLPGLSCDWFSPDQWAEPPGR